ncbi:hypothetical protein LY76DRAFT_273111 [Colletotrichum caudatum]|nr:hypothetical protein LY76DRAFT_273111 [Colletotrichum caudatum]
MMSLWSAFKALVYHQMMAINTCFLASPSKVPTYPPCCPVFRRQFVGHARKRKPPDPSSGTAPHRRLHPRRAQGQARRRAAPLRPCRPRKCSSNHPVRRHDGLVCAQRGRRQAREALPRFALEQTRAGFRLEGRPSALRATQRLRRRGKPSPSLVQSVKCTRRGGIVSQVGLPRRAGPGPI